MIGRLLGYGLLVKTWKGRKQDGSRNLSDRSSFGFVTTVLSITDLRSVPLRQYVKFPGLKRRRKR